MSILIIILIVIGAIVALFLLAALFTGKEMNIEKSITIARPQQQVFEYIKFIRNHDNFSVWAMMDPEMKKEYRGTDGQPGFVYAWDSSKKKNVGAGEQEIKKIEEGKSIEHELRFTRPMQDVAKARFNFEPVSSGQTKVQWGFYSKMKFPMNAMKPLIQGMLSKNLETGLNNLKTVLEK
jgi:Polyketide cyclase / dehydrase and lipid transport